MTGNGDTTPLQGAEYADNKSVVGKGGAVQLRYVNLAAGDAAPWFRAPTMSIPNFTFDTVAGRYIVLCFLGSSATPAGSSALAAIARHRRIFDDGHACLFGVTIDAADAGNGRLCESIPGIRHFLDLDGAISRAYGALPVDINDVDTSVMRGLWFVLSPALRIMQVAPFSPNDPAHNRLFAYVSRLPSLESCQAQQPSAPVLHLPDVFEPDLCRILIDRFDAHGGEVSGFMQEKDGRTVLVNDPAHKRRRDYLLDDRDLIDMLRSRIRRRIAPEIAKVHQFHATRMERYLVGCYTAEDGGHFRAHRDNTTKGTAHRRFAVSINLNAEFDGGGIVFPEYGSRTYKPAPGAAIVFSCSLLHAVSRVTNGRRYAFLPFLYDEDAAKLRTENLKYLGHGREGDDVPQLPNEN